MLIRYIFRSIAGFIHGFNRNHYNRYQQNQHQHGFGRQSSNHKNQGKNTVEDLTKCKYCDIYLPTTDSIFYHGEAFCCTEHANQFFG